MIMKNPDYEKEHQATLSPFSPSFCLTELAVSWLLCSLACSHEFDELPVRHNEEVLNKEMSDQVRWGADTASVQSPETNYI